MRFVSATGADATALGNTVSLRLGSLFSGDERRVIVELVADGGAADIHATASWNKVGRAITQVAVPTLSLLASADPSEVERGRDGAVLASATSVTASKRQLEAASAYARGDIATANRLAAQNEADLNLALTAAPAAVAPVIAAQRNAYTEQKKGFNSVAPRSAEGRTVTKAAAVKDLDNLNRASSF
jgi:Ca-activated chloride channel family protein